MKIKLVLLSAAICSQFAAPAQAPGPRTDSSINNLVLPAGYAASTYGAIPNYVKKGRGKKTLILIPGLGFDASVFNDFMEANKKDYTMFAITIPGYGNTMAPPMPDTGTSYGAQTWNRGVVEGLVKLIEKEKLAKPVLLGHFVQGVQIAVRMAADHPDKVGGLILLGGPAKFVSMMNGQLRDEPLSRLIQFTDKYTAPVWFRHMRKEFFDANNFLPEIYSLDSATGQSLWKQSAKVILPVAIRYSCEYFASDARAEMDKIKCPTLVLRALFNERVLQNPVNKNYLQAQFIDSWNNISSINSLVIVEDIAGAAGFVWKDKPVETYASIKEFLDKRK